MSSAEKTRGGAGARRRRLLWTALPAAVVLAAAARLLSLAPVGAAAEGAFTDKDAPALAAAADWLGTVNFFEQRFDLSLYLVLDTGAEIGIEDQIERKIEAFHAALILTFASSFAPSSAAS